MGQEQIKSYLLLLSIYYNYFGVENKQMKKVHPQEILNNNSISQISTNQIIGNSVLLTCRECKKTKDDTSDQASLILPCKCSEPIHKSCLLDEMKTTSRTKLKRLSQQKKEKRYNCKRCSEVIRFSSKEYYSCRSRAQMASFSRANCCLCASLSIATVIILAMLIFLIVIKVTSYMLQNEALFQAAVIGISIAIGVLFLFVAFFFISQVLLKSSYNIDVLKREDIKKEARDQRISIQDCV